MEQKRIQDTLLELLNRYDSKIEDLVVFVAVLLLVAFGLRFLLRRVVFAMDPEAAHSRRSTTISRGTAVKIAVVDVIAWSVGMFFACEATGIVSLFDVAAELFAPLVWVAGGLVVAALAAYSWSAAGNELMLSLLGWFQLRRDLKRRGGSATFDLHDGHRATLEQLNLLNSAFRLTTGESFMVSNADVMRDVFGFGKQPARREGRAGGAAVPPTPPSPPPPTPSAT